MGELFDKVNTLNAKAKSESNEVFTMNSPEFLEALKKADRSSLSEVTYYTCMKILSETMGKIPFKFYQNVGESKVKAEPTNVTKLLTLKPNPYQTPLVMKTYLEYCCQEYGNAYCYIQRQEGVMYGRILDKVQALWPLHPADVQPVFDNAGIFGDTTGNRVWYIYTDSVGNTHFIPERDMIHLRNWMIRRDGFTGMAAKEILKGTFSGAQEAQEVMNNQYQSGLTAAMALQYTGDFDEKKIQKLRDKFASKLSGSKNAGAVVPVPIGLQLTPLNNSMQSAQFAELRRYTALQISAAFGIKPTQINDYEKASYASSEAQQIDFLQNTMQYRITAWEEEFNAKLLTDEEITGEYFYKMNEKVLLRSDAKTQSEILVNQVLGSVRTQNEARRNLDLPDDPNGDQLSINGSYIPLSMLGEQYQKGGVEQ